MRFRYFLIVLLTAALAHGAELPLEKRVVEHTTANGIRLLVLERHFSPTVSIRMMFRTGSVDEVGGKTGLAHMFEHMMFKGTRTLGTKDYAGEAPLIKKVDQLHQALAKEKAKGAKVDQARVAALIEELRQAEERAAALTIPNELWNLYEREGASNLNAGTAPDFTQYVLDLPSNKLALWAMVDADRLKNAVFRQFYPEREVVKEERRMRVETNPDGKLYESFLSTAFSTHPYHNPTIGWDADLDNLTVEDLQDFYQKHYRPERLTIAVVGDVKAAEVIALVDKHFGTWKPAPVRALSPIKPEPPQTSQRRQSISFDAEPHVMIGFHVPPYPDPDHFLFTALSHLLGDGQSSRLYRTLVEKKRIATAVDTDASTPGERYEAMLVISASPRFPRNSADIEKVVFEELELLKTTPIDAWEVEKVRARVDTDLLNTLQTNDGMAGTLVYCQSLFGDWRYSRYQAALGALSAADIQRAAQRIFQVNNSVIVDRLRKVEKKVEKKKS